jgi:hypothetical protein
MWCIRDRHEIYTELQSEVLQERDHSRDFDVGGRTRLRQISEIWVMKS